MPRSSPARPRLFVFILTAILVALVFVSFRAKPAEAGVRPSTIEFELFQAQALAANSDNFFPPTAPQDFYPRMALRVFRGGGLPPDTAGPVDGQEISQRDWAAWEPSAQITLTTNVLDVSSPGIIGELELWDADDLDSDDLFDIDPQPSSRRLTLIFDACSLHYSVQGSATRFAGRTWLPFGGESDAARVEVRMGTADGRSFLADNVTIADATPVQAVYHPRYIIEGKPTAFMVDLTSSYLTPVNGTVTVEMNDGGSVTSDSKAVVIPPGGLRVFLFDGSGSASPYEPTKEPNFQRLQYTVTVDVPSDANVPDPGGPFPNCIPAADNVLEGNVPLIRTHSPTTLYLPWDFDVPGSTVNAPSVAQVRQTFSFAEPFRRALFPIADTRSAVFPGIATSPYGVIEPAFSIFGWSIAAHAAGLDQLILMPRRGWFASNADLLAFGDSAIGMSLGEFAPHAVIAEQGLPEVPAHEQGHTYQLSQRRCSTGGATEDLFLLGCRDEYTHAPEDGRPYPGSGYDVRGEVYPSGAGGVAGTREVWNITNFMDNTGTADGAPFGRWIDNMSYDWLSEQLRVRQDPPLVTLSGYIEVDGGLDAPGATEVEGFLSPSFRFDGIPDRDEAALNVPEGSGLFFVRLVTSQGVRSYYFDPVFEAEGDTAEDYGFFSFAIPWDPATTQIELGGPSTVQGLQQPQSPVIVYDAEQVSPNAPTVTRLRAGVDTPPDLSAPGYIPPVAYPGEDLVIAWNQQDADPSESMLGILLLIPPDEAQDVAEIASAVPIAVNITDGMVTIPAEHLADLPGAYGARVLVSDGINTTSLEVTQLFTVDELQVLYLPVMRR